MRQITNDSVNAFLNAKKFKKANMEVEVLPNVTLLKLHSNIIAYLYNDPEKTLTITNCGWFTPTTKERLNALPNVHIKQKNFKWFLNGQEWGGEETDIIEKEYTCCNIEVKGIIQDIRICPECKEHF